MFSIISMPNLYVTAEVLQANGIAPESDDTAIWEQLAESVSRLFDRECEVSDGFFNAAEVAASARSFLGTGTEFVKLYPYISGSIGAITVDGEVVPLADTDHYNEADDYLIFTYPIFKNAAVSVSARWGFAAIPADIVQACIEQALYQWRKKDLAFAELAGVPTAAVAAQFSPTFAAVANRYRGLYSRNNYFA